MPTSPQELIPRIRTRAGELLSIDPDTIDPAEELKDQGLDSVRIADLLSFIQADGWDVDLADLMEDTSLEAWEELLQELEG